MMYNRVIPVLLLEEDGLVKTRKFKDPVYLGDPINAVRIFNEKQVDELILLDIRASSKGKSAQFELISDIVSESFMPLGYGGGLKSLDDVKKIFDIGIEKVVFNTHSLDKLLIESVSAIYGSQSVVVSIDVKKTVLGRYAAYTKSGTIKTGAGPLEMAKNAVELGAGEIIIQSIDHEGCMNGTDLPLVKLISEAVDIPVVATGGVGSKSDIRDAIVHGGASAVAVGSLFVYKGKHRAVMINYPTQLELSELFE